MEMNNFQFLIFTMRQHCTKLFKYIMQLNHDNIIDQVPPFYRVKQI